MSSTDSILFNQPIIGNSYGNKIFLLKFDNNGNLIWSKTGTTIDTSQFANNIAISKIVSAGNDIYVSGTTRKGSFTFLEQTIPFTDMENSFVFKVNSSGNNIWSKFTKGKYGNSLTSIATDGASVFLTGQFRSSISIDSDTILYAPSFPNTNERIFNIKLDSNGSVIWSNDEGGLYVYSGTSAYGNAPRSIIADNNGSIYVAGSYQDITGGGSNGVKQRPFISKYNSNSGQHIWTNKNFSPGFPNEIRRIMLDSNQNLICTGWYNGNFEVGNFVTFTSGLNTNSFLLTFNGLDGSFLMDAKNIGMSDNTNGVFVSCMSPTKSFFLIGGRYQDSLSFENFALTDGGYGGNAFWCKYSFAPPTSIQSSQNKLTNSVAIFPNPSGKEIVIDSKLIESGKIIMRNSIGNVVYQSKWNKYKSNIGVSTFPQGIYSSVDFGRRYSAINFCKG